MENNNQYINCTTGLIGLIMLTSAGAAWANDPLPAENKLDPSYYDNPSHTPRIDFTNIDLFYVANASNRNNVERINRKWHKLAKQFDRRGTPTGVTGVGSTGNFVARSSYQSGFTLDAPGYEGVTFDGYFSLSANIADDGSLEGGSFSFLSVDELFGFGTETVCNREGSRCREKDVIGEVFGGTLTDLGWSESESFIEFSTNSFTGWACEMGWCTDAERLWFNVDGDSIGFTGDRPVWGAHADGTAVIPVPAAAWLFGSGLIALTGFSRRKKPAKKTS